MSVFDLVLSGDIKRVKKALKKSPEDMNATCHLNRTPLIIATINKNLEMVNILLGHGAQPNIQDENGCSALHFASQDSNTDVAMALLEHGAEIDLQDNNGNTALSNAVFNSEGRGDLIRLLLDRGADKFLENNHGVSPLSLAETIANYDVKQFME